MNVLCQFKLHCMPSGKKLYFNFGYFAFLILNEITRKTKFCGVADDLIRGQYSKEVIRTGSTK